jgi:tight adherence protein C
MSFIIGIAIVAIVIILLLPDNNKKDIEKRLEIIAGKDKKEEERIENEELNKSFKERIIIPLIKSFSKKSSKKTAKVKMEKLKKELAQAGYPWGLSPEEFMAVRTILILLFLFLGILICVILHAPIIHYILAFIVSLNLAVLIPNFIVKRKIKLRKKAIEKSLPDCLDLLTVSVEAGLGFDSAMTKVVEKFTGPIAEEFNDVLNKTRMGKQRKDAMREMAERMEVDDLSNFISSLIQAEQLGVSIGNVLRIQSQQARQRRRQRAEEAAMKAPVKMLLPLVGCVFPTIFIIIFTPIVISVYKVATKK